jgi:hypothetical protein
MMDINACIFECRSTSTDPRCSDDVLAQGVILVRLPPPSRVLTSLMHFSPCIRLAYYHAIASMMCPTRMYTKHARSIAWQRIGSSKTLWRRAVGLQWLVLERRRRFYLKNLGHKTVVYTNLQL